MTANMDVRVEFLQAREAFIKLSRERLSCFWLAWGAPRFIDRLCTARRSCMQAYVLSQTSAGTDRTRNDDMQRWSAV